MSPLPEPPRLKVSQAISLVNGILQDLRLIVEGEVAGYSVSQGKFIFFDLKDETEQARLSCFMMLHQLSTPIEDGMRVVVTARPGLFTKSGKFSLTVQHVEPDGEGSVKRAFELLKAKLETEGLFSPERKRLLPRYPQHVGVISSRDAAGYGDFMRIVSGAMQGITYSFINVSVQGVRAEQEICAAIDQMNGSVNPEVIVLLRGGGSMEDLHAFNSEHVARAIVRSRAPVLVGVGHERDVTIADFCADVRAATPSNAAQILIPTREDVENRVHQRITYGRRVTERSIITSIERVQNSISRIQDKLRNTISTYSQRVLSTNQQIARSLIAQTALNRNQVMAIMKLIAETSPVRILERGYSVTLGKDGKPIIHTSQASSGDSLTTHVSDGTFTTKVI